MKYKKILVWAGCLLTCAALTVGSVSSAPRNKTDDLKHLQSALLREDELSGADDIDGDGVIDVFDLVQLRQQIHYSGEVSDGDFSPTLPLNRSKIRKKFIKMAKNR